MVVGPPALVFLGMAFVLVAGLAGFHPLWPVTEMTVSEAAALRDPAAVVRLVQEGHDPNRRAYVRPGILRPEASDLTPLEAAVAADRVEVAQVLLKQGATLHPAQRQALICFAWRAHAREILQFLDGSGALAEAGCEGVETPW